VVSAVIHSGNRNRTGKPDSIASRSRLAAAGKNQRKIVTAVGRELLGFIWAIGCKTEAARRQLGAAA
jgi:hypothetical protein